MAETALQEIKDDLKQLHVDLAFAEKNRMRWTLIIMWLVLADLTHNLFDLGAVLSLVIALFLVAWYRVVDIYIIIGGVKRSEKFLKSFKGKGGD